MDAPYGSRGRGGPREARGDAGEADDLTGPCQADDLTGPDISPRAEEAKRDSAPSEPAPGTLKPPAAATAPPPAAKEFGPATAASDPVGNPGLSSLTPVLEDGTKEEVAEEEEEEAVEYSESRELAKLLCALIVTFAAWIAIFVVLGGQMTEFYEREDPDAVCRTMARSEIFRIRSCEPCGQGTNFLPFFWEYEKTWRRELKAVLYFFGLLCVFMGVGIGCDQFMAAIEEITAAERVIWKEVHNGAKRKFRVKVWNPTVANLTLMALGSSAPEILLSSTELMGNGFYSGSLGPLTIIGSAAFNLFIISAVCVSAIPAPELRRIEGMDAFKVTATASIWAYLWLLVILLLITPNRVDIWEGAVTFSMFWLLIVVAFAADKGWLRCRGEGEASVAEEEQEELDKEQRKAVAQFGKELPQQTLKLLREAQLARQVAGTSKAQFRRMATSSWTGGRSHLKAPDAGADDKEELRKGVVTFGFQEPRHVVPECVGTIQLRVVASRSPDQLVQMHYFTREGTAKESLRYKHTEGFLSFGPGVVQRIVEVPIIDDELWQPEEEFYVELDSIVALGGGWRGSMRDGGPGLPMGRLSVSAAALGSGNVGGQAAARPPEPGGSPKRDAAGSPDGSTRDRTSGSEMDGEDVLGGGRPKGPVSFEFGNKVAQVTVLNDDIPGTLDFDVDEVLTSAGTTATLGVVRTEGHSGEVTCDFETVDDTAIGGKDYAIQKGQVTFADGERHKTIQVEILTCDERPKERFKVILSNASPGALFDASTDGGATSAICDIEIAAAGEASALTRLKRAVLNEDRWEQAKELWTDQAIEMLYCGGSPEDQSMAGVVPWAAHLLCLPWKVGFAMVPPPLLGGGWPCFVIALAGVGFITAVAGDMASLLGCALDMPDDITAITLVALGTSLPDTIASRTAAQHDDCADNAVGNVTGSNSVNVFLGCGISWTVGAIYWSRLGATEEWMSASHSGGQAFKDLYLDRYPDGGFFVTADTLSVSVAVYCCGAGCCLSLLAWRRGQYGGELGGPQAAQYRDAALLVCLWVIFIIATSIMAAITSAAQTPA